MKIKEGVYYEKKLETNEYNHRKTLNNTLNKAQLILFDLGN